ncbi:hypothetical protein VNO77_01926 [Canavalia gladiata]|uniref:Uncharacterized protein n=1 Tax=Canavalia gladiata TaxID=3824 RepID=A0AAN9R5F4_CANGL
MVNFEGGQTHAWVNVSMIGLLDGRRALEASDPTHIPSKESIAKYEYGRGDFASLAKSNERRAIHGTHSAILRNHTTSPSNASSMGRWPSSTLKAFVHHNTAIPPSFGRQATWLTYGSHL